MRDFVKQYIMTRIFAERIASIVGIIIIVLVIKDFVVFFLAAFLCAYLFRLATEWSQNHLRKLAQKSPRQFQSTLYLLAREKVLLTILYILFA